MVLAVIFLAAGAFGLTFEKYKMNQALLNQAEVVEAASTKPAIWCGLAQYEATTAVLCEGNNPKNGCPAGYQRVTFGINGGTLCFSIFGCGTFYTCVKGELVN